MLKGVSSYVFGSSAYPQKIVNILLRFGYDIADEWWQAAGNGAWSLRPLIVKPRRFNELLAADALTKSSPPSSATLGSLEQGEREHITNVLEQTRWAIEGDDGAASILCLNPSTLRGRIRKLVISKDEA